MLIGGNTFLGLTQPGLAFVKRRADEALRWESLPDEVSDVSDGWHPAVAVQDQAAVWAQKWRANSTPDHAAIDVILA